MRQLFFALLTGLILPTYLSAQSPQPASESIFGKLQRFDSLSVTIETDIKELKDNKSEEHWQPGIFKVMKGDSVALKLDIQVAARGNMRKKTCEFPPIKIKFYSQEPENDSLADINELKLVTSCHKTPLNEEWVQKEYVVYELYNLLTEQSFRVKPAIVKFVTPEKPKSAVESFSFFIESEKELSARLNCKPLKPKVVNSGSLDPDAYDRMSVFEFMIGNTDWSTRTRHNVKTLFSTAGNYVIAIPYDFDYAGLVGTDYAVPADYIPIQSVQERYFLGLCRDAAQYQKVFDFFLSKKQALLDHCEQHKLLSKSTKKQMKNYLTAFFDILESPSRAKREILQNCNKAR